MIAFFRPLSTIANCLDLSIHFLREFWRGCLGGALGEVQTNANDSIKILCLISGIQYDNFLQVLSPS
jgi:hypothetical protein